jgi:hypothetical protein
MPSRHGHTSREETEIALAPGALHFCIPCEALLRLVHCSSAIERSLRRIGALCAFGCRFRRGVVALLWSWRCLDVQRYRRIVGLCAWRLTWRAGVGRARRRVDDKRRRPLDSDDELAAADCCLLGGCARVAVGDPACPRSAAAMSEKRRDIPVDADDVLLGADVAVAAGGVGEPGELLARGLGVGSVGDRVEARGIGCPAVFTQVV